MLCIIHYYLYDSNWIALAKFIGIIYHLLVPHETFKKQKDWSDRWAGLGFKIDILQQRKIHLLEYLEDSPSSKSPTELKITGRDEDKKNPTVDEYESKPLAISQRLFILQRTKANMFTRNIIYPILTQQIMDEQNERQGNHYLSECILSGGCCARDCGCCEKPRRPRYGRNYPTILKRSHCTAACGFCV